jgi:hypothetical protein
MEKAYRDFEDIGLNQYFGSESALIMVHGMRDSDPGHKLPTKIENNFKF